MMRYIIKNDFRLENNNWKYPVYFMSYGSAYDMLMCIWKENIMIFF